MHAQQQCTCAGVHVSMRLTSRAYLRHSLSVLGARLAAMRCMRSDGSDSKEAAAPSAANPGAMTVFLQEGRGLPCAHDNRFSI